MSYTEPLSSGVKAVSGIPLKRGSRRCLSWQYKLYLLFWQVPYNHFDMVRYFFSTGMNPYGKEWANLRYCLLTKSTDTNMFCKQTYIHAIISSYLNVQCTVQDSSEQARRDVTVYRCWNEWSRKERAYTEWE